MKKSIVNILIVVVSTVLSVVMAILLTQNYSRNRHDYEHFPLVHRYNTNVNRTFQTYGDLVGMQCDLNEYSYLRKKLFWSDAYGFINPPTQSVRDTFDFVTLGDSYTASSPISQDLQWPHILRLKSGKRVYNLGHPAEGPWHQFANMSLEIERVSIAPDAVLIWQLFQGNDLEDSYYSLNIDSLRLELAEPRFLNRVKGFIRNSILGEFFFKADRVCFPEGVVYINDTIGEIYFLKEYIERSKRSLDDLVQHPNYENMVAVIEEMKYLVGDRLRIILLPLPSKPEVYHWRLDDLTSAKIVENHFAFNTMVCEVARILDLECLDISQVLYQEALQLSKEGKLIWWEDDTHLNELGNALVAENIRVYLDANN